MKIVIAADHGGFELKQKIKSWLQSVGHEIFDVGAHDYISTDSYADFVGGMIEKVRKEKYIGLFVCRSGTGPAMMANRFSGVRAAVCTSAHYAKYARLHQDANVIALGGDVLTFEQAQEVINTFLETEYEGGRHDARIGVFNNLGQK